MRQIVLIPVYNEEEHLQGLLARLREIYDGDVLFVDDGSIDCSPQLLRELESSNTRIIRQPENRGYGATLLRGFSEVIRAGYDYVITMDSDGQHRPDWIPEFFEEAIGWDVVSGSRYLQEIEGNESAPTDRREINTKITALINEITVLQSGLSLVFTTIRIEDLEMGLIILMLGCNFTWTRSAGSERYGAYSLSYCAASR